MTIFKCDICNKELKDLVEKAEFIIQRKKIMFDFKHQKQDTVGQFGYLLCPDCAEKVEYFIKQEVNK